MTKEKMKENTCRLCLKFGDDTFSDFSDLSSKEKLKIVLPELDVNNPHDFVICSKCRTSVEQSYQFIKTFSKNDEFIRREKSSLKIVNRINLNRVVKSSSGGKKDMNEDVCRICLKSKVGKYTYLSKAAADKSIHDILDTCLSKLDKDLTLNPVFCEVCLKTMRDMYTFKTDCMKVEKGFSGKQVDLSKVLDSLNEQNSKEHIGDDDDDDVIMIDDDDLTQVFDQAESDSNETNKKRPLPEAESAIPSKKQKSSDSKSKEQNGATADEAARMLSKDYILKDLPHFNFNYYSSKNRGDLEEWMSQVDKIKKENNWTDYMTMNKVLEKLSKMSDVHTCFSDMSKELGWDEWKQKLINIFPHENDYGTVLKKMVNRKKKSTETYIEYYMARMKLLKLMKVTKQEAISCLIGGIFDVVVSCIARAANYTRPRDLLRYFKTCDKKYPVAGVSLKKNVNKKPEKGPVPQQVPQIIKRKRCGVCRRTTHASADCPKMKILKGLKLSRTNRQNVRARMYSSFGPAKDIIKKPQGHKAGEKPLTNSTTTQKQSEQRSPTIMTSEKRNKPQDNVPVNISNNVSGTSSEKRTETNLLHKQASTTTALKPSKDAKRDSKQAQSDGKGAGGAVADKKRTQNDADACFVKPQPPTRKITSPTSQTKGGDSNSPRAKDELRARGTSAAKQNEVGTKRDAHNAAQKSQNKENKGDTSNVKTQVQNKQSLPSKDKPSTKPITHSEKSNKDTKHEDQRTKHSSNTSSSRSQDQNKRKDTLTKTSSQAQSKATDFVNFVKPTAPSGGSNANRIKSEQQKAPAGGKNVNRTKPGQRKEAGSRSRSDASLQDSRGASYYNRDISDARSLRDMEERAAGYSNRGMSTASLQDWRDESYYSRDISSARSQRDLLEERAGGYPSRGISSASLQDWRDESYYGRDISGSRLPRDIELSYADREASAAAWRDYYYSRGVNDVRLQEYMDERYLGRAGSYVNRDESSTGLYAERGLDYVRPEGVNEESYRSRDLFSSRFQESMDASSMRAWNEREARFEDMGQGRSGVRPLDEREARYEERMERGTSGVRPWDEREAGFEERMERDTSDVRPWDEREARFEGRMEQGTSSMRPWDEREARFKDMDRGESSTKPREEREARFEGRIDQGASIARLLEGEARFEDRMDRGASSVRPRDEREARFEEHADRAVSSARPQEEREARFESAYSDGPREEKETRFESASSTRPREEREARFESSYSARLREERDAQFEEHKDRGASSTRPRDEREARFEERIDRSASSTRPRKEREARFEKPVDPGTSSTRPREDREARFEEHVDHGSSTTRSREEREARFEKHVDPGTSSTRPRDDREARFEKPVDPNTSSTRPREDREARFEEHVDCVASSARSREVREPRFEKPIDPHTSSAKQREEREKNYTERARPQEIERDNANTSISSHDHQQVVKEGYVKGILKNRSPMQNVQGDNANWIRPAARSQEEWVSSYVDGGTTGVKRKERDGDDIINNLAPSVRRSGEKDRRGPLSEELLGLTHVNRDAAPSARPRDGSYSDRVAPTASSSQFDPGSSLNRSTLSDKPPMRSGGSYFSKSITSTRLLGSSLGSLFNLSLASRPFTSYPSCVTTAKPLGLTGSSYFNRGLSHNQLRGSERSKDTSEAMFSRRNTDSTRGQLPTLDSYNRGVPIVRHQEQSHRELCLKCYTIGHNSVDCPRFKI